MPLKFLDYNGSSSSENVFSNIQFHNIDSERYYTLTDPKTSSEIRVKYVPLFESPRDPERYDCILFENSYLIAENDVFEIYESSLKGRFGWIFPISTLDSNENDYVENDSFKHYRHIAYKKLLSIDYKVNIRDIKDEYQISEIFQGVSVCILSKDEIAKLNEFKITDYTLSFLKYDYLILNKTFSSKKAFKKDNEIETLRKGNHKIKIKKAAFDITSDQFTNSLFIDHVYQTENILIKYILLYQILEQFIQEYGDNLVDEIITEYKEKKITKNTLKEKIGKLQNDRVLLKMPFEKSNINLETRQLFIRKCTFLFSDLKLTMSPNFEDAIYDLRNLVTHNYRALTNKTDELNDLIYIFELIVIDLLNNFNEKQEKTLLENITEEPVSTNEQKKKKQNENLKVIMRNSIILWNHFVQRLLIKV